MNRLNFAPLFFTTGFLGQVLPGYVTPGSMALVVAGAAVALLGARRPRR